MTERKTPKRLHCDVDEELHREVKKRAAERGIHLRAYLMQALLERIERDKQYE